MFALRFNSILTFLFVFLRKISHFRTLILNTFSVANDYLTSYSALKFPLISYMVVLYMYCIFQYTCPSSPALELHPSRPWILKDATVRAASFLAVLRVPRTLNTIFPNCNPHFLLIYLALPH